MCQVNIRTGSDMMCERSLVKNPNTYVREAEIVPVESISRFRLGRTYLEGCKSVAYALRINGKKRLHAYLSIFERTISG